MNEGECLTTRKPFLKKFWWVFVIILLIVTAALFFLVFTGDKFIENDLGEKLLLDDRITASFTPESGAAFKYNSPTIVDDEIYIGTSERMGTDETPEENFKNIHDNFFYKMDLDLNVVWQHPLGKSMVAGAATLDSNKDIYFLTETFKPNMVKPAEDGKNKDQIYLTTLKLVSLTNDGKLRWERIIGEENEKWDHISFSISIDNNDNIYFGHEKFYSYNTKGNQRWQYPQNDKRILGFTSTPIIDKSGFIYFVSPEPTEDNNDWGSENIKTYKFSPDGKLTWSEPVGNEPCLGEGPREVNGPRIGSEDLQKTRAVSSIPAFGLNEEGIYTVAGCTISKLSTVTGKQLWSLLPEGATGSFIASPVVDKNGSVYIGTKSNRDSTLFAVSSNGTLMWKNNIGSDLYSSPLLGDDGKVYIGSETTDSGHYHALDIKTGDVIWSTGKMIPDFSNASAALYKGFAYLGVHYKDKASLDTLYKIKLDAYDYQIGSPWPRIHGGNSNNGRSWKK